MAERTTVSDIALDKDVCSFLGSVFFENAEYAIFVEPHEKTVIIRKVIHECDGNDRYVSAQECDIPRIFKKFCEESAQQWGNVL